MVLKRKIRKLLGEAPEQNKNEIIYKYSTKYEIIAVSSHSEIFLAHDYNSVDHTIVWGIIEENLDNLYADVVKLLEEAEQKNKSSDE